MFFGSIAVHLETLLHGLPATLLSIRTATVGVGCPTTNAVCGYVSTVTDVVVLDCATPLTGRYITINFPGRSNYMYALMFH